ncbi:uncharacterized protein LOC143280603 [Babylonia areolata]|uniref:uncharacterized protein LOC143280603 n=1 Tax=Babylonia areolata TaxID=304850 RepID=UPI003FCF7852
MTESDNGDVPDRPPPPSPSSSPSSPLSKLKVRSQSATRPLQNGHGVTHRPESPVSGSRTSVPPHNNHHPHPHRHVPPKSAPSLRQRSPPANTKGRAVLKPRDQNGVGDSTAEVRTSSPPCPTPHHHRAQQMTRTEPAAVPSPSSPSPSSPPSTGGGSRPAMSSRQPSRRRRLTSRSEDLSTCSSSGGDSQSPRLSVSDHSSATMQHQQHGLNGGWGSSSNSNTLLTEGPHEDFSSSFSSSSNSKRLSAAGKGSPATGGAGGVPGPVSSAWDVFEEHVRTIHDSSDLFSRYQGPSFQASSTFQETMMELYGHPDYSHPPGGATTTASVATRGMMVAGAASRFLKLRKMLGGGRRVPDRQTVENAKRGWRVLKQYVQDNYTSKRTSQAALSWSMLRHTLKGLSDMEKTRVDLYRRYGIMPTMDNEGRLVTVNTMLSQRAQQAIASGSRHPHLAHTSPTTTSSSSSTTKALSHDRNKALSLSSLPADATSSSLLFLSSSSSARAGTGDRVSPGTPPSRRRRAQSSVTRGSKSSSSSSSSNSARGAEVRTSVLRVGSGGGGGGVYSGNRTPRRSAEFVTTSMSLSQPR